MLEKQKLEIGNNSTGIQVNGDYIAAPSYTDIKAIFMDLFQLNFPKVQEIAAKTATERVNNLLDRMKESFDKHKNEIDIKKFEDPFMQYEMQSMAMNVAKRGDKSNTELLTELLCTVASKNCPELIELISSEAMRVVPLLSKRHLDYLSLEILILEAGIGVQNAPTANMHIGTTLGHLSSIDSLTVGDLQYLACTRVIEQRGITYTGIVPSILKEVPELKGKQSAEVKKYCVENNLKNICRLMDLLEKCYIGHHQLLAIGRLIGWLNLGKYSGVDIKTLF